MSDVNVHRLDGGTTGSDQDGVVFENPTTLKVYLYLRSVQDKPVGTRETQRQLDFNSPGTVQWHMDKLRDAEIVEKLPSNQYQLTEKGKDINSLSLPLEFPFKFMKGQLIPKSNFHLSFAIVSLVILLITIYGAYARAFALFLAQAFMIVHVLLYAVDRLSLMNKLQQFIKDD